MRSNSFNFVTRLAAISALLFPQIVNAQERAVIENGKTVSIEYVLKLDDGSMASSNAGQEPLVYKQGEGQILAALEDALNGRKEGEEVKVSLEPEQGYGPVNPDALVSVPVEVIPEGARVVGTLLTGRDAEGNEHHVRVHEVKEDGIIIDHNHPLAGQKLHFEVKIISVE